MSGHGHVDGGNKQVALLVAVLAALLAFSETGGKSAQTKGLGDQIEASNLWSFYQAKTIRQTTLRAAAESVEAQYKDAGNMPPAMAAQLTQWKGVADRYESEPKPNNKGEGRRELSARAIAKQVDSDKALSAYHLFEYGSAAFQLAIVLAGASALTAVIWLTFLSYGLGVVGLIFTALGFFAPTLVHL